MTDHFDMPDQPQGPTSVLELQHRHGLPGPLEAIQRALENGALPETLAQMMSLQERFEANQARAAFNAAIAAAKSEITPIVKTNPAGFDSKKTGERTGYKFEDLAAIARAVDPILAQHGLGYRYSAKTGEHNVSVTCILFHRLGHSEEATLTASLDTSGFKNPIQALGSSITYLQRYTLKLALGLSAEKDDDAHAAGNGGPKLIDAEQFREIMDLMEKTHSTDKQVLYVARAEDGQIETLTQAQYREAKAALLRKLTKMKDAAK